MKKLTAQEMVFETVELVRADLDDLNDILALFAASGMAVTITSGGYEFESLRELNDNRGARPSHLQFAGRSIDEATHLNARVTFKKQVVEISIPDATAGPVSLFQLRDRVRRLRHPRAWLLSVLTWIAPGGTIGLVYLLIKPIAPMWLRTLYDWCFIPTLLGFVIYFGRARFLGVTLRPRHQSGIFYDYRDKLVPGVILAMVSAALGVAFKVMYDRMSAVP